ncbi:MAG: murein biosynthesis integral membrane protein MurJ [Phycisphaerae bacterium]|nr:murein biosynthesis integral membrane protein MurJ [Phycisphaerae bacterium]
MTESGGLARSARIIALLTMASRVFGLVRESLFSFLFGTSDLISAFRIAWMLPNLARRLFGEGALSAATIPVLSETVHRDGVEESRRFVGSILVGLALALAVIVLLAELVILVALNVVDDPALRLSQILLPYTVLICLVAIAGGVLNVYGHFTVPAAVPLVMNLAIIVGTLGGALLYPPDSLALMNTICVFALLSGIAQFGLVWWMLARLRRRPIPALPWHDPRIRRVLLLMGPMVLGLAAVPINTLVDYAIAYGFIVEEGNRPGPAVLGYAQYLYQLPLGVFGIAIATAAFPALSARAAAGDLTGVAGSLNRGLRLGVFVSLPATVGLVLLSRPLVAAIYQHGEFDATQSARVAPVLALYSLALAANFAQHVVVRTYYALKRTADPARIALVMVGLNFVLNLALVFPLKERGLALSSALCAWIQVIWLALSLGRFLPAWSMVDLLGPAVRALIATAVMGLVVGQLSRLPLPEGMFNPKGAVSLLAYVLAGVVAYLAVSWWLGAEELRMLFRTRGSRGGGDSDQ